MELETLCVVKLNAAHCLPKRARKYNNLFTQVEIEVTIIAIAGLMRHDGVNYPVILAYYLNIVIEIVI